MILADPYDLHADAVLFYINKAGAEVVRLYPAAFEPETMPISYTAGNHGSKSEIVVRGKRIAASSISGVFCRNWSFPKCDPSAPTAELLAAAEKRTALQGFFHSIPKACWVNPPWREIEVDNKLFQYRHAVLSGLTIPDTLVTSNPNALLQFYDKHRGQIIIKQMSDISIIEEVPFHHDDSQSDWTVYGFYTRMVTKEDLKEVDSLVVSPCLFQEAIPKKAELRVTIVGDRWFAHRIDSQSHPDALTDFRRVLDLPVEEADIPVALGRKLTALRACC